MAEQTIDNEVKEQIGDASIKRINIIYNLVKEYFRAINNGTLNSNEFVAIGFDTVMAGLQLISRSNDMDCASVDDRITMMKGIQATLNSVLEKVYLDPQVVSGMVARASMETLERKGLAKNLKKEDK